MAEALSDKTIDIVKSTVPALEKAGTAITDRMYQLLFRSDEVRDPVNQSHHGETGSQSKIISAVPAPSCGRWSEGLPGRASR
jgi:nitric oxide dioxygenase